MDTSTTTIRDPTSEDIKNELFTVSGAFLVGEVVEEDEDYDYDSEEDHDSGECDVSAGCAVCCKNGDCTSKSEFGNQGQYHTGEGTYVPCNICEKHFRGALQPVAKCKALGVPGYPGFFDCNGAFLQSVSVEKLIESGIWVPPPKKVDPLPTTP